VSSRFERVSSETEYDGAFFSVRRDVYRHEDGEDAEREIVSHTGAVGIVALDGDRLWFVRQPREAIGAPDLLEIPAGSPVLTGLTITVTLSPGLMMFDFQPALTR